MATTPLADGFPEPTREQWLERARQALKGAAPESLAVRTAEGLLIEPLYGPGPPAPRRALRRRPGGGDGPWDIRAIVAHPDPAEANAQVLEALAGGAASVLLKVDPEGAEGRAVASADDLGRALDRVVLEAAAVALDAGFLGPLAAEWLGDLARGSPGARLAPNLDPLGAFARAGRSPGSIDAHVTRAAGVAADLARTYPQAELFLASGVVAHEAGGSAAQELGVMAAAATAYARALVEAGLPVAQALAGITLGVAADADYFLSLAKLRAGREIWARIAAACASPTPARIEARGSRRMLTRLDPHTNLIRQTAAAFAAAAGGADAIALDAFTQPLGRPAPLARRLAWNTQLILAEESGAGRVDDPAAGAWHVEALTDQLARNGWAVFQAIEARGGLAEALASRWVAAEVEAVRAAREAAVRSGETRILGVTLHADAAPALVEIDDAPAAARPAVDVRQPGPDSLCPPLTPRRLAEPFEGAA